MSILAEGIELRDTHSFLYIFAAFLCPNMYVLQMSKLFTEYGEIKKEGEKSITARKITSKLDDHGDK